MFSFFFFFNDTATTEIYTLSLHDALPILVVAPVVGAGVAAVVAGADDEASGRATTRSEEHTSDSSHPSISYAVFCLKKKKKTPILIATDMSLQRSPFY